MHAVSPRQLVGAEGFSAAQLSRQDLAASRAHDQRHFAARQVGWADGPAAGARARHASLAGAQDYIEGYGLVTASASRRTLTLEGSR